MSNTKQNCIDTYNNYITTCDAYRDELVNIIIDQLEKNSGLIDDGTKKSISTSVYFPAEQFAELDFAVPNDSIGASEAMFNAVRSKLYYEYGLVFERTNNNGIPGYNFEKIEWKLILLTEDWVQTNNEVTIKRSDFFPEGEYEAHKDLCDRVWEKVVAFHKEVNDVTPVNDECSEIKVKYNEDKHQLDEE